MDYGVYSRHSACLRITSTRCQIQSTPNYKQALVTKRCKDNYFFGFTHYFWAKKSNFAIILPFLCSINNNVIQILTFIL